jgi:hypothetical protein
MRHAARRHWAASLVMFEELHRALVLLGSGATPKRAEIAPSTRFWIGFA